MSEIKCHRCGCLQSLHVGGRLGCLSMRDLVEGGRKDCLCKLFILPPDPRREHSQWDRKEERAIEKRLRRMLPPGERLRPAGKGQNRRRARITIRKWKEESDAE